MEFTRKEQLRKLASYGLTYLLWAISLPLGGWVIYDLRDAILTALAVINAKLYHHNAREAFYANLQLRAADTTSWLFVGIAMVVLIVLIENIYRVGMLAGRLWSRFSMLVAVCFGLLCLINLANNLMRLLVDAFTWGGLFAPIVFSLVAVFSFWLERLIESKENLASGNPTG
jgi:membrane protease YdiL (CAAX protease family)